MATDVDLRELAIDRSATNSPPRSHRRSVLSRYVAPGVVLAGFLAMLLWAAGHQVLPRKPVTVVPVVVTRADVQQAGTPLFQAAGWIEPRPTAVVVSALAEGIIEELLVVEGQEIEAGQPVARLIDADANLALQQTHADLALRTAELEAANAELHGAKRRLENPVHLQAALADAESLLAKTEAELARMPFLIRAAAAKVQFAEQNLAGKRDAGTALAERLVQQAQSEFDAATAELKELEGRKPLLEQQATALRQKRDAVAKQLELLIDESQEAQTAEARVKSAEARLRQAELSERAAQLRLERMVVTSPAAGRVLALVAQPGSRVMGMDPSAEHKASTVITLYDPAMLQVRADVRLEDMPLVQPGQPVQVETASAKAPIQGEVLYVTSQANVQKNTLEVKVALHDPPPTVRPEMLVAATFLAPEERDSVSEEDQSERLLVPRQLVETEGDTSFVWLADASGVAKRQSVQLGRAGTGELLEVREGLAPTDRLISDGRKGLSDGDRVTITGEDDALGIGEFTKAR